MEIRVGVGDLLKMGTKLIGHKIVQYRLGTKQTKVVCTRDGQVRGHRRKTLYDEEVYFAFEGIPFAQPPVGELRFRAPQPALPWLGVRDCTYPRAKPMQKHFVLSIVEGSEDCLYLNVYSKRLKSDKPLPVIVWIYGGGFQIGEAGRDFYSPDYFMQHDVVVVTFNYRVGALGFLSLTDRDLDAPGNAGLKDQVMALRWISQNIAQFNGDPQNITLMGESAGAASVHAMMTTEQTRGLFHKAIMQSGSMFCEWANEPSGRWAHRLACQLGYSGSENEKEVFRFLQKAPASEMAAQGITLVSQEERREYVLFPFTPVVEPYITRDCVLPRCHREMLPGAWGNDLPLILGGNSFEGLFAYQSTLHDEEHMLSAFEVLIPREIREKSTQSHLKELLRQFKVDNFEDATRGRMEFNECLHILSVKHFWHGIHRTVLARLSHAPTTPTYLYRFDVDSPHFNHFRQVMCGKHVRGVSHADDISYLFYHILANKVEKSSMEYQTIQRLVGMWVAFARNDNPNCPQIGPITWEALDEQGPQMCLNIGKQLEFIVLPESKQNRIWDRLYDKHDLFPRFWANRNAQLLSGLSIHSLRAHPDCMMALWKRPRVCSVVIITWTAADPALSPINPPTTLCSDIKLLKHSATKSYQSKLKISCLEILCFLFHFLRDKRALNAFPLQDKKLRARSQHLAVEHEEVNTTSGPVRGKLCSGVYGEEYVSFERIPYAQPPVGPLRFMAPLPVEPWSQPLDCTQPGQKPLQFNHYSKQLEGVEDCLYLNVFAKELDSPSPLPMIVFFFGGGFEKGDPTKELHSPDYFMMRDVVVVTVSYRVGPLGFLSLNDPAVGVPGNAGLKDQLLAMQWIKENAERFNGDPKNVTAFGESAGAASVHYLMLNSKAEGLFQKAILQSGNVLCSWALCSIKNLPHRLAVNLGMESAEHVTDAMVLDFLQKLPGEKLVRPYLLSAEEHLDDCVFQFGPVVEPYKTEHCALPKHPQELLDKAWGNRIPVLMSGTSFEGLLMYARVQMAPYLLTSLKKEPEHMLPLDVKRNLPQALARHLGQRLQETHFGESDPSSMSPDSLKAYCEYASYKVFWHPILKTLRSRVKSASSASTYLYRFDFDSPTFNHQRLKYCGDKLRGVAHVDDHSYLWYGDFSWKLDKHTPEFLTIERMIDMLTSFARTSNPNCKLIQDQLPRAKEWKPLNSQSALECLNISENIKLMELPELQKLRVWESVCQSTD
ncbi:uncharacterized protein LOC122622361 [Drosophila teissieri]|uniref:uncharacterized protein LOC122622361 n=1 Tax=Drosophila teissieri TaxID=7243 RepID=UPI001CBA18FE|nr:uncharacterized protein LOC122622361 [Drosophila teissieri]